MALDRQSIEKKDFPIGRRGYDPNAVDAHLSSLAEQVEELRSSARRRSESLAETAAEQVRAIVEASEASANQIRADAEKDARDIRRESRSEAKQAREEATAQASQYVASVSVATGALSERVNAIEAELGTLLDGLRTSANRATADLQLLESHLTEVRDAVLPRPEFEPEEPEPVEPPRSFEPLATEEAYQEPVYEEPAPSAPVYEPEPEPEPVPEPAVESDFGDDTEGARLIALNMALNGTPRDEVDRYLAENFELSDRAGLIEEVYASVEG
ncbi:MAG: DivIVA domain-containing protein [Solirubrobacteraceae bacterium]